VRRVSVLDPSGGKEVVLDSRDVRSIAIPFVDPEMFLSPSLSRCEGEFAFRCLRFWMLC